MERIREGEKVIQRQIQAKTRPIIESLDNLRILLGSTNVQVLTPKAEIKMRTGSKAQIPLKVSATLQYISIEFSYSKLFPSEPIEIVSISNVDQCSNGKEVDIPSLVTLLIEYVNHQDNVGNYCSAVDIVNYLNLRLSDVTDDIFSDEASKSVLPLTMSINSILNADTESPEINADSFRKIFTCKLCSCTLFNLNEVSAHSAYAFNECNGNQFTNCTSVFLSLPPTWLEFIGEELEGKLYCRKCKSRVGSWSWIGKKCSCNEWISPAYQFTVSKIDCKYI